MHFSPLDAKEEPQACTYLRDLAVAVAVAIASATTNIAIEDEIPSRKATGLY